MTTLALSDVATLGILRVDQVLGPGGTSRLSSTGNGCFWVRPDGKVAFFQIGQFAPEYFASGWPIIEWEIDPAVAPGASMNTAPRMRYVRTIGDFFNGHIIAVSGRQENWVTGGFAPPQDLGGGWLRFRWTYSDGYVGYPGYPQYGFTDLNYTTGAFRSYGPFKIAVDGHRHIASQIVRLPQAFVNTYCPGYSYAAIGYQGSGALGSPFGSSLIAIEDFDPTTMPPATTADGPAQVRSIYLIHHGPDTKMRRPTNFALCGWDAPDPPYDCRLGHTIQPVQPLFGGTPNGGNTGVEANDTQVGVQWFDLPDKQGLLFFYRLTATPEGYHAPNDPNGYVHAGYGNYAHGDQSGSGYALKGCCHAQEGVGQFDPDWGSTGPFATFHMPCASIYPVSELVAVRTGAKQVYECVPTTELKDWRTVDPLYAVYPPRSATDVQGVVFLSGTSWVDPRDRRFYVLSAYDFVTDSGGARLPHLSVYSILGAGTAPVLANPGPQTATEGVAVMPVSLVGSSGSGALTFTVTGLPPGVTLNASTGVISGTPPLGSAGTYTATATATAAGVASAPQVFTWTVLVTAPPPAVVKRLNHWGFDRMTPTQLAETGELGFVGAGVVSVTGRTGLGLTGTGSAVSAANTVRTPALAPSFTADGCQGFAVQALTPPAAEQLLWTLRSAVDQALLAVSLLPTGAVRVYQGSMAGALLGTSAAGFVTSAFRYLEIGYTLSGLGRVEIRSTSATGVTLAAVVPGGASATAWAKGELSLTNQIVVDDWYVNDGLAFSGDLTIGTVTVVGPPTVASGWTANGGTDLAAPVDDAALDEDATCLVTKIVSAPIRYAMETIPDTGRRVDDVKVVAVAKAPSLSFAPPLSLYWRRADGVVLTTVFPQALATSYRALSLMTRASLPPGEAWTIATVNDAEFGVTS